MNWLSLNILVFSPLLISILFLLPIFSGHSVLIRRFAKGFAGIHFVYALLFLVFFNTNIETNYETALTFFNFDWLGSLGISLTMGLDGISIFFVILTSFIVLTSAIASKGIIKSKHGLYYALIFIVESAILGVFCAQDMFEFFMFWELELIPMYFLIGLWGEESSAKKSAMKFLLYTFLGSLFMLCGFLMLYNFNFISTNELTADMRALSFDYDSVPIYLQLFAAVLMFIGFAVKMPIIPLHTWLPNAHTDAPAPVSMILAALLLKMGAYGILRFNIQLLPDTFLMMLPYLTVLAFINITFAAIVAYYQTDIKKIVAYSSISSMGIVLLGFCSLNLIGISGAIFLMLAHGIISAGLFFIVGIIYKRTGTRDINQLGGIAKVMPRLAGFTLILVMASIGLPGLIAFVGEFLVFFGTFISSILNNYLIQVIALASIIVLILSACYMLKLMHGVFYGVILERWEKLSDILNHELFVLLSLSLTALIFGIMPMTILNIIEPFVGNIIMAFGG
ncbi:MAG: NuoM family protein [Candidatus Gastranaerophilaceae bacterium]